MNDTPLSRTLHRWRQEAIFGTCDTGRYRCRYFEWGSGPAIIFIHGLTDEARSFVPAIAELVAHFRCIAYELPAGKIDGARLANYQHADFVADLIALMDFCQLDQASVLGSSFGSTIALRALHDHPQRLPRGILQGGFAHRPLLWPERALASFGRYIPGRMWQLPLIHVAHELIDRSTFRNAPPEFWKFFNQNSGDACSRAVAIRALILDEVDLRPLLPSIHQPVLMIGGEADLVIPPHLEAVVLQSLPNVRRIEFPGCGHYPQYINPVGFAGAMREFIGDR